MGPVLILKYLACPYGQAAVDDRQSGSCRRQAGPRDGSSLATAALPPKDIEARRTPHAQNLFRRLRLGDWRTGGVLIHGDVWEVVQIVSDGSALDDCEVSRNHPSHRLR